MKKLLLLAAMFGVCAVQAADIEPPGEELVDLTMPVSEGGVITADSTAGNNGAAVAFDNDMANSGSRWLVSSGSQPCHVTYDFGTPTIVNALRIWNGKTSNSPADRAVKNFKVMASNDNSNWEDATIYTSGDETGWTSGESRFFYLPSEVNPNANAYRYWRFEALTPVKSGDYIQIHELEFFNVIPLPKLVEATVVKAATGVATVTGTMGGLAGSVAMILTATDGSTEIAVGSYAAGASFSTDVALAGVPLDVYYSIVLKASNADGATFFAIPGTFFFGEQRLPVTSYGGGQTVSITSALPLSDGNVITVDADGATFNAGNSVFAMHASMQADGAVKFTASNIGVVGLTGSNRFSGGLNATGVSALNVASHDVLGGADSQFLAYPHLSIIDGFMTSFAGHGLTKSGSFYLDLQKPGSEFLVGFDVSVNPNSDSSAALYKYGPGKLTLAAPQTYHNVQATYGTFLYGGELLVDGAQGGSLYKLRGGSMAIGSGLLNMKAAVEGATDFAVANVNIGSLNGQQNYNNAGGGTIRLDANGGAGVTMGLSNLVYTANSKGPRGRYLGLETVGNAVFHTTSANDAAGALSDHRVVLNGADWAAADENGFIVPFTGYAAAFPSADDSTANIALSGTESLLASRTVAALKLSGGASLTIADGEALTLASGAILKTGDGDASISGGSILSEAGVPSGSSTWTDLLVVTEGSGTLTIGSAIMDNATFGDCWLTKAGKGTLRFAENTVAFKKGIYVLDGTLEISKVEHLGSSFVGLFGGRLKVTDDVSSGNTILSGGSGAYFDIAAGKTYTMKSTSMNGYPLGGTTGGYGAGGLHLDNSDGGDGVLDAGTIKCTGGIFIDCGIYRMRVAESLHLAGVNPLYFGTGAVMKLQMNGQSGTVAGVYGGTSTAVIENTSEKGSESTLTIATGGTCDFKGEVRDGGAKALNLVKYGCGRQTLSGACSYTGTTRISNGTLAIDGAHTGGGAFEVVYPGALGGTGTVSSAVSLIGGGTLAAGGAGTSGVLTIGSLTSDGDSMLSVAVDGQGLSRVNVTGSATVAGTVIVDVPPSLANTPCRGVVLHAEGGLTAVNLKLDTPVSKLKWSLVAQGKDLVLKGAASGFAVIVR